MTIEQYFILEVLIGFLGIMLLGGLITEVIKYLVQNGYIKYEPYTLTDEFNAIHNDLHNGVEINKEYYVERGFINATNE